ncbi:FAD-binding oxidoreductase [Halorubrum sp. Atlit-8R]|uniref:FAD-binding and (Fe-S)-binding domain-containing protein n=1 Tax=unclassified Halorubrum TaxID=2642239 RepID=UPI000EF2378D|nr:MULTISPECIES: FAD-binding and (Fe-S)-binding domain-containing protein [unclassified Halorubrum]RLM70782.1 FAD-binding oxidoreductase [Halorubrum sp. Atlit-9R]RLM71650.1 FAD-binding oxidoreductase [Halorubrum sp. Atlit-9R]RLM83065.1 FAD-binding oxidoreductase [Halorubrum sp. Atlit-8R]
MATNTPEPDPTDGGDFDYTGGSVERPDLVDALDARVDGDVRFDDYSKRLYATDASAYEVTPIGVVIPESTADVAAVHEYCFAEGIPVLPRGGGTSLAGQTVNEAVVLDLTGEMDAVIETDADAETARVQAGAYVGDLNAAVEGDGLKFAPDPAWRDKSAVGGAIGNNSTGSHSLKYGKTDHYVEEVEVVLADGTVATFGEVAVDELRESANADSDDLLPRIHAEVVRVLDEEADRIDERYPELKRNVSGYNLDRLLAEYRGEHGEAGVVNLARLMAGSEGTLATVTEATVSLVEIPETKAVALLTYDDLLDAMEDVAACLEHDPAAVEVMDDVLLGLAADTPEFEDVVGMLPEGTDSALLVEFYADSDAEGKRKVADLIADRVGAADGDGGVDTAVEPSAGAAETTSHPRRAAHAMEAHDPEKRDRFWKMRKAGLPILLSRTTDEKHISFIEDCAIPPEHLPEYTREFQEILADNDTFATFYAHAGPGVLHVRPLINTKDVDDVEAMLDIADRVTDAVVRLGGSVSGEHGDGRARTQWNRKLYGDELWEAFRDLKTAFDPDWLLNPGNVCGEVDMRENLRFDADYEYDAGFDPAMEWAVDNGMQGMVELCHGCGGCRGPQETTGGVMCPTYRAADEEIQSTRGRANMLRGAINGELPDDPTDDEFVTEVMDLCVGCKGCKVDCPSGVDMAKLKAEVEHAHHEEHGADLRTRLLGRFESLAPLASRFAPLSNLPNKIPGSGLLAEKALGIARERDLPTFRSETLVDWFEARGGAGVPREEAARDVLLFPDVYTTYTNPGAGKAAVRVLEAADCHVRIPDVDGSGRPPHSKGLLDVSRATAKDAVETLAPDVRDGWDVVVVEPSDAVMLQSDYHDLLDGDASDVPDADVAAVSESAYGVMEYVDAHRLDEELALDAPTESLTYHGHCHQKATKKDHHAVGVLRRAGYGVDPLDSSCCGMAGSFGYEAEHYSMSKAIGETLFEQVDASGGDALVAPGTSCRTQLEEGPGEVPEPTHPIQKLAAALA